MRARFRLSLHQRSVIEAHASGMRHAPTRSEELLWRAISGRKLGVLPPPPGPGKISFVAGRANGFLPNIRGHCGNRVICIPYATSLVVTMLAPALWAFAHGHRIPDNDLRAG